MSDLDKEELEYTRRLNGADREIAKTDRTYCTNVDCAKKCWRHTSNYRFKENTNYSFIDKCL